MNAMVTVVVRDVRTLAAINPKTKRQNVRSDMIRIPNRGVITGIAMRRHTDPFECECARP